MRTVVLLDVLKLWVDTLNTHLLAGESRTRPQMFCKVPKQEQKQPLDVSLNRQAPEGSTWRELPVYP